jgi:hypothetical protein
MVNNNWRDTLFVWDGILSRIDKEERKDADDGYDGEDLKVCKTNDVRWNGTWIGSDSADATKVPTPKRGAFDEYVSSEHFFNVEGVSIMGKSTEDTDGKDGPQNIGVATSFLHRVAMIGGTGYDLGEGSEKKKHKDDRHDMYFFSPSLRWTGKLLDQVENMVLSLGENEFGRFISVGWLRVGNRVTLARRYLDDTDERSKWDLDDLRSAVFDQIATIADDGHVQLVIPPWQCSAMHADPGQLFKRQKHSEE